MAERRLTPSRRFDRRERGNYLSRAPAGDHDIRAVILGGHPLQAVRVRPPGRPRPAAAGSWSGASSSRSSVRGASRASSRPWSKIATRSHNASASSIECVVYTIVFPALLDLTQEIPQVAPRLRVQRRGRLVQEQQLRVVDERARDRQPLPLAAGELVLEHIRPPRQSDHVEHLVSAPTRHPVEGRERLELFACGELLEERAALQLDADPREQSRIAWPRALAQYGHLPGVGPPDAFHDLERGGLAGAVRSQDAEELTHLDLQRQPVDGDRLAIPHKEITHVDGDLGTRRGTAGWTA